MEIVEKKDFPGLATVYLAELRDDPKRLIEFVDTLEPGIGKASKWVMMISTQFGCPVGCSMCDAGALGFMGNLTAEEMMAQIDHIVKTNPAINLQKQPKLKIHFARMGDPALNPNVLRTLELLAQKLPYSGIIPSISSVAPKTPIVARFFERLAEIKDSFYANGRFQLQFSLHTTNETERLRVAPVKKWSFEEVADYGDRWVRPGDRKITLNFALSRDSELDAKKLKQIFPTDKFLIKITPINPTDTADKNQATYLWNETPLPIEAHSQELKFQGFEVILSPSLPEEIAAATSCGQLWSERLKKNAATFTKNLKKDTASYITPDNLNECAKLWMKGLGKYQRVKLEPNPHKTALLVIDMQEFFLNPRSPAYLAPGRAILHNVHKLVETFRKLERPVYFSLYAEDNLSSTNNLMSLWWKKTCLQGTPEAHISYLLEAEPEKTFLKSRYSIFTNPDFVSVLNSDGIEELVICGVMTNLCVETSVRNAFDLGFKSFVIADATASHSEELHLASLKNMAWGFASILTTEELISKISELSNVQV